MNSSNKGWWAKGILALAGALVYLPLAGKLGLLNDDWYLIYDAHSQGAQFFHEIYAIDRPARAYVMQFFYSLFGDHILYYHLSAYVFRVLSAWSLLWALDMTWQQNRRVNYLISFLFLIYPGFLSQINPIDYQSQILSLFLALFSIACTLKTLQTKSRPAQFMWFGFSTLSGVFYPALVDYFMGLEVLRLALVINLVLQQEQTHIRETFKRVLYRWAPFLIGPLTFILWRVFFFTTERRATDLGVQVGQLFASPLTGLRWMVNWLQDTLQVLFMAWFVPLDKLGFNLSLGDTLLGMAIAILVSGLALLGYHKSNTEAETSPPSNEKRHQQLLLTGLVVAVFALLPVIVANRQADFDNYSRYTLASAAGAGMFLTAAIMSISSRQVRLGLVAVLVFMSSLVHHANAVHAVQATESVRNFWWQVAWRAPGFEPGVTLIAEYPASAIQEDYFIWGPANLIYYPERQNAIPIEIRLPAAVLTPEVITQISIQRGSESPLRRGNQLTRDFRNVLIMTQATPGVCVRILDGQLPEISINDAERIRLIAFASRMDQVKTEGNSPTPPAAVFGAEPAHDWCYYYQKASLARQRGEWDVVAELGDEAQRLGLHPNDPIEWLPFLQAYAVRGDKKQVKEISTRINTEQFYRYEACNSLGFMKVFNPVFSPEMQDYMDDLFCQ